MRYAPSLISLAVTLTALTACGNDQAPDRTDAAAAQSAPTRTEGASVLVKDGPGSGNVGPRGERDRLMVIYAAMQRDFAAGNMTAVCRRVSTTALYQFPPGPKRDAAQSCTAKLSTYARMLDEQGVRSQPLEIVQVRVYEPLDIGGVTVKHPDGDTIRIPFKREDGGWKLELGIFDRPDTLRATLPSPRS